MIDDEHLIDLVKANDIIYNKYSMGYKLPEKKKEVWKDIAKEIGVQEKHCIRRWTSLRERFTKEFKRFEELSDSTTDSETWPLFHSLSFLKEHVKLRPARCTPELLPPPCGPSSTEDKASTLPSVDISENIKDYFKINKQANTVVCVQCGRSLCGILTNNMKRHYKLVHKINIECKRYKEDFSEENLIESAQPCVEKKTLTLDKSVLDEKQTHTLVNVEMDMNSFFKCCIGMLVVEDLPIDLFDDREFFKVLMSPFEKKFHTDINSVKIQRILDNCRKRIKSIISRRLKYKLISLKLDMSTQRQENMVILSAQYMTKDFKICTNALGIFQLQKQSSASQMKAEIVCCLNSYNLDLSQIYTITLYDSMNSIETRQLIHELNSHLSLVRKLTTKITSEYVRVQEAPNKKRCVSILTGLNCAAHIFQLAAKAVLDNLELNLNECRHVVRKVHSYLEKFNERLKAPSLDDGNEWLSTCEMLKSLLNIKDFIESKILVSSDGDFVVKWEFITDFLTCFKPLEKFFNKLFEEQYVIGDFYRDWLECESELENLGTSNTYASHLRLEMENQKSVLLQNNAFLAALYLDPRFNLQKSPMLMPEQKSAALTHVINIYDRMMKLQNAKQQTALTADNVLNYCDLDKEIPRTSGYSCDLRINTVMESLLLDTKHYQFELSTDVLQYWKKSTFDDDVRNLAQVILSVPVIEFSMHSTSSSLTSTIAKYKTRFSDQTLNNLILTKLNFELINAPSTKIN